MAQCFGAVSLYMRFTRQLMAFVIALWFCFAVINAGQRLQTENKDGMYVKLVTKIRLNLLYLRIDQTVTVSAGSLLAESHFSLT